MTKPSEKWPGFAVLPPESDNKQIKHLLSSANFEHMKQRAINSRRAREMHLPEDIDCSINQTHFAMGFHNLVLELMFSDHVYWIARIPYGKIDDKTKTSLLSEIATMKIVR
ncbi:hypothetical protein E8E13_004214 [Curvularia kusanoi]|uniref:Uncharacterized protein n=1 Tax=Curvularia kusanoi TaxID=90978 RepID=A0A9P4TB90_CURKU|nr:hypothetical protein E8E13_004214 [Curvularia kusanoi]